MAARAVRVVPVTCVDHEKVYSGEYYATYHPRYVWVCAKCCAEGMDTFEHGTSPEINKKKYDAITRAIHPPPVPWEPGKKQSVTCEGRVTVTFDRSDEKRFKW